MKGNEVPHINIEVWTDWRQMFPVYNQSKDIYFKGEVHSRMAMYFLYANKKFIQRYVIHQKFSLQRAL